METITLTPQAITEENFAPYGKVIMLRHGLELSAIAHTDDKSNMAVKVIQANKINMGDPVPFLERHPLSTQTFIPMNEGRFVIVVAKITSDNSVDLDTLRSFITNGSQGIQYDSHTWHMPFSALDTEKQFAVIDRHPNEKDNKNINILFDLLDNITINIDIQ